jgi:hypothetical protein
MILHHLKPWLLSCILQLSISILRDCYDIVDNIHKDKCLDNFSLSVLNSEKSFFLRSLFMEFRLALNSCLSCFGLPSTGITAFYHQAWHSRRFLRLSGEMVAETHLNKTKQKPKELISHFCCLTEIALQEKRLHYVFISRACKRAVLHGRTMSFWKPHWTTDWRGQKDVGKYLSETQHWSLNCDYTKKKDYYWSLTKGTWDTL